MKPSTCHPDRKHYGHGLCQKCYRQSVANATNARRRARYAEDPAPRSAQNARYKEANREKRLAAGLAYRRENRDRLNAESRRRRAEHNESINARRRALYEASPDRRRENNTVWANNNPEAKRERVRRRRARLAAVTVQTIPPAAIQALHDRLDGRCVYCQRAFSQQPAERATVDHLSPVHHGGPHTPGNITLACQSCNASKGAKPLEEWVRLRWPDDSEAILARVNAARLAGDITDVS